MMYFTRMERPQESTKQNMMLKYHLFSNIHIASILSYAV